MVDSLPVPRSFVPDDIPWETASENGTQSATLVGSREAGVAFSYAFFIPAGVFDAPHSHIADAHLLVVRGELLLGYGSEFQAQRLERYPAGSFLWVPAGAHHFDGADVDTILIGTAVGPWSTDYVIGGGRPVSPTAEPAS